MESAESATIYSFPDEKLLPAICPGCAAPGTKALPLPCVDGQPPDETIEGVFCDLCAEAHQRATTGHIAIIAAWALFVLAVITANALWFGSRNWAMQAVGALLLGTLAPWAAIRLRLWRRPVLPAGTADRGKLVVVQIPKFAKALREHDFVETSSAIHGALTRRHGEVLLLGGIALVWFFLLHSLGGADVRVLVGGHEEAVLLVDSRHRGRVAPTNSEDPRAGRFERVLGGRRYFELVSTSGITLEGEVRTVWPGRTYIVGHLPQGRCLYWETKKYGSATPSLLYPLGGDGPIWELRDSVDSWFIPLQDRSQASEGEADWESSGGTRRAIRLLPCRASSQSGR